jgi:hypothetical protein
MAYVSPPTTLPAFPDARPARNKTPFPGGRRKRWKDPDGRICEWDYQHGAVEAYDKHGRHDGQFEPYTGERQKPPDASRRVVP